MSADLQKMRDLTQIIYFLYAATIFAGVTAIVAIIINYLKRDEVAGTWLESHFRWQIRTFWFCILWCAIGWLTFIIGIGFIIWGVAAIWAIYRIVKGMLNFYDNKPMYQGN
jgi:uncharacterized membrane protein